MAKGQMSNVNIFDRLVRKKRNQFRAKVFGKSNKQIK